MTKKAGSFEVLMKIGYGVVLGISIAALACSASPARNADTGNADAKPRSQRVAAAAVEHWPEGRISQQGRPEIWNDGLGVLLEGMDSAWFETADPRYYNYIKQSVDRFAGPDGVISTGKPEENQLGNMLLGRQLLLLSGVTQDRRYAKAATRLYEQKYPGPMRPETLYAAEPFYAEYASKFHHPEAFEEIARQFTLAEKHARDATSMGWYLMALVDTLAYYPESDAGRKKLIEILRSDADAALRYQDRATGLWRQALDKPGAKGNTVESSASCMLVYALARAVREGYLPESYLDIAERGYRGILISFITVGARAVSEDPTDAGAFVLASVEIENAGNAKVGRGATVMMDGWFNSQKHADASGQQVLFHYKWDELSDSGFSLLGHAFRDFGAKTKVLADEPTLANLHEAQVFLIVSPDNPSKNPNPNYMQAKDVEQIADWVKAGGVLAIFENDPQNADLEHLNLLAERFGIHYNSVLRKHVEGDKYEMGKIAIAGGGPVFRDPHSIYMKDVCTISVSAPAVSLLNDHGEVFMATAKYGKGTVFATVDPWLYNEYTDGRKLPIADFDNYAAGRELVRWILEQVPSK